MDDASHAELLRMQAELAGSAAAPGHGTAAPDVADDPAEAPEAGPAQGPGCGAGGLVGRLCAALDEVRGKVRRRPFAGMAVALLAGAVAGLILVPPPPPRPDIRKPAAGERPRAGGNAR